MQQPTRGVRKFDMMNIAPLQNPQHCVDVILRKTQPPDEKAQPPDAVLLFRTRPTERKKQRDEKRKEQRWKHDERHDERQDGQHDGQHDGQPDGEKESVFMCDATVGVNEQP